MWVYSLSSFQISGRVFVPPVSLSVRSLAEIDIFLITAWYSVTADHCSEPPRRRPSSRIELIARLDIVQRNSDHCALDGARRRASVSVPLSLCD